MPDAALADDLAGGWLIEPRREGLTARVRELWTYRRLWWYFASSTITDITRKSTFGWVWFLMRVSGPIGLSSVIFGGVLGAPSDGTPYFLFFLCGNATWLLFDRALLFVTRSIERNRRLITKVYFPRMILPLAAVSPALLYLVMVLIVIVASTIYFHYRDGVWYVSLGPRLFAAAGAVALSLLFAIAVGFWTSVLQARHRDVRYGLRYAMPFWFYITPVIYPMSHILQHVPSGWQWVVALNPMAPIVELFKWATLGQGTVGTPALVTSTVVILGTLLLGGWFFNREESASIDRL